MKNSKKLQRNSLTFILALLCLSGCHKSVEIPSSISVGEEVVKSIPLTRAELQSMRVEAKVDYRRNFTRVRFHASFLVRSPGDLFVQTSGFGVSAALISVRGDKVTAYLPTKNELYKGDSKKGISTLLRTSLSASEWMNLFLGHFEEISPITDVKSSDEDWVVLGKQKGRDVKLILDQHTGWLKSCEYQKDHVTLEYGSSISTSVGGYPSQFSVQTPDGDIILYIEKVEANPNLKDEDFDIETPKGLPARPLPNKGW